MIQTEIGLNAKPFARGVQQAKAELRGLTDAAKVQAKTLEDQFKVINIFRAGAAAFGISVVVQFFQDAIERAKELGDAGNEAAKSVQRLVSYAKELKGSYGDAAIEVVGFFAGIGESIGGALAKLGNFVAPKLFADPKEVERVKERQKQLDALQKLSEERKKKGQQDAEKAASKASQDGKERERQEVKLAELEKRRAEQGKSDVELLAASNKRLNEMKNKAWKEESLGVKASLESRIALAEELLENANLLDRVSKQQLQDDKDKAKAADDYAKAQQSATAAIQASAKARQAELAGMASLTPKEQKELARAEKDFKREADKERRRIDKQRREDEKREKGLAGMNPRDEAAARKIMEREEKMRAGLAGNSASGSPLTEAASNLTAARARAESITEQLGANTGIGADTKVMTEQLAELRQIKASLTAVAAQK